MAYEFQKVDWAGLSVGEGGRFQVSTGSESPQFAITTANPRGLIELMGDYGLDASRMLDIRAIGSGSHRISSWGMHRLGIDHSKLLDGAESIMSTNFEKPSHQETMSSNLHTQLFRMATAARLEEEDPSWYDLKSMPRRGAINGMAMSAASQASLAARFTVEMITDALHYNPGRIDGYALSILTAATGIAAFKGAKNKIHGFANPDRRARLYMKLHPSEVNQFSEDAKGLVGVELVGSRALEIVEEHIGTYTPITVETPAVPQLTR